MTMSAHDVHRSDFVTVAEVAAELNVTQRFVRRLIADCELHAVKVGSRLVRIRREDVEAILRPMPVHARRDQKEERAPSGSALWQPLGAQGGVSRY